MRPPVPPEVALWAFVEEHRAARPSDARGRADRGEGGLINETRSLSDVRIDDRGWGRYVDIPLACPRNRERYTPDTEAAWTHLPMSHGLVPRDELSDDPARLRESLEAMEIEALLLEPAHEALDDAIALGLPPRTTA